MAVATHQVEVQRMTNALRQAQVNPEYTQYTYKQLQPGRLTGGGGGHRGPWGWGPIGNPDGLPLVSRLAAQPYRYQQGSNMNGGMNLANKYSNVNPVETAPATSPDSRPPLASVISGRSQQLPARRSSGGGMFGFSRGSNASGGGDVGGVTGGNLELGPIPTKAGNGMPLAVPRRARPSPTTAVENPVPTQNAGRALPIDRPALPAPPRERIVFELEESAPHPVQNTPLGMYSPAQADAAVSGANNPNSSGFLHGEAPKVSMSVGAGGKRGKGKKSKATFDQGRANQSGGGGAADGVLRRNPWVQFLMELARKTGRPYMDLLRDPAVRAAYRAGS